MKFTLQGYIIVKISYQNGVVVFLVKDTGIGISKQLTETIFEPFVQADTSLTRRHHRYGLGLSISRELVRRMGAESVWKAKKARELKSQSNYRLSYTISHLLHDCNRQDLTRSPGAFLFEEKPYRV